ncbi:MAG: MaoC family dehydratase N-terminal domain-containing protein [Gammaproteobacteria bacterium]|jgi:acyl dehydratase|nr:MaoC family dehydratase N-terminal domain-containing protein [Gammaproteobacteria bacterium]
MLDRSYVGHSFPTHSVPVEAGQLRFFAKAVGEESPVYHDREAARAAGYRDIPAPPTFVFSLGLVGTDLAEKYLPMGVDLARLLHGEQQFEYFAPICAGDVITLESKVTDIYDKKGGALEFAVEETTATNQDGELVAKAVQTLVMRNG